MASHRWHNCAIMKFTERIYDMKEFNKKSAVSGLLAVSLIFSGINMTFSYAADVNALPTSSKVIVDGSEKTFDAYNIAGYNYFKLRDIAFVLSGTQKQFEVGWDNGTNTISILTGKPYTTDGNEMMSAVSDSGKIARSYSSDIYLDGVKISPAAYNIDGYNYFKLRDLGKALDFYVGWDGKTIYINSSEGYEDENSSEASNPAPILNSLPISQSLKNGMTESEFNQAYEIAYGLVSEFAGYTKDKQIVAAYQELAFIRHTTAWEYSMSEKHYNDAYGFFVLNMTSCAGDVRAAALCMSILGIPSEHVNENQFGHQWLRVEFEGDFIVVDVNAPFIGYELVPYQHPLMQ